jgi:hypothetical protein
MKQHLWEGSTFFDFALWGGILGLFYYAIFYFFVDLEICICHNKLASKLGYLFCRMAIAKFEVEKFDGHNSFSICYNNKA